MFDRQTESLGGTNLSGVREPAWVELEVRDVGAAVTPGTPYTVTLPDGRQVKGKLDASRIICVDGVKVPGDCKIELELEDGTRLPG